MDLLINNLANRAAQNFGEAEALKFPGDRTLSFADVDLLSGRLASGLAAQGIRRGDRVAIYMPDSWRWIVAYHAIARLGAVTVHANILLSAPEVEYIVQDSGAKAIFLEGDRLNSIAHGATLPIAYPAVPGAVSFDDLLEAPWLAPVQADADDLMTIGYTSGTTGKPKGAMQTQGNVFGGISMAATIHVRSSADRVYAPLPLAHVYGNFVMNAGFLVGARTTLPARFDAGEALAAIAAEKTTLFEGVPTMYYQILAHPDLEQADLSGLKRCTVGGQTMPIAKIEAVVERFGCPLLELWGMTEMAGPAITHSPYWSPRHGSIGLPFPGTEARIASLSDPCRAIPAGESGELQLRGPLVTRGYWKNDEATAACIDAEGWFATGDIARADKDGYLYIVDRKKDLILTGGYNVYPAELEQVISSHASVSMVAVVGGPDEDKGEIAHAFIVKKDHVDISKEQIIAHCKKSLAAYKIPRVIHFVDSLPTNSTGKIMRRTLSDQLHSSKADKV